MSRVFKLVILLIALISIDVCTNLLIEKCFILSAKADIPSDQDQSIYKAGDSLAQAFQATTPRCNFVATEFFALIAGITALIIGTVVGGPIGLGLALIPVAWMIKINIDVLNCFFSFVLNPVMRCKDPNFSYKSCTKCLNAEADTNTVACQCDSSSPISCNSTDKDSNNLTVIEAGDMEFAKQDNTKVGQKFKNYSWPRNQATNGSVITVCYRSFIRTDLSFSQNELTLEEEKFKKGAGNWLGNWKEMLGEPRITCLDLKEDQKGNIGLIPYKAVRKGNKLCVNQIPGFSIPNEIGCITASPKPPGKMCDGAIPLCKEDTDPVNVSPHPCEKGSPNIVGYDNTCCSRKYVSKACHGELEAHSIFPMSSVVYQCIRESLSNILTGDSNDDRSRCNDKDEKGLLEAASTGMKSAVILLISLAAALLGYKIMLGMVQSPAEIIIFLIKIGVIMYFAVGPGLISAYNGILDISTGLAEIVTEAGGNNDICKFTANDYSPDKVNLSLWDSLDCRVLFYLGTSFSSGGKADYGSGNQTSNVIGLMVACIESGMILIWIAIILYAIFLVLVVVWIVHLMILALIALSLVFLFGPLFIPMMLFERTKGYFDGWLKQVFAFALYPLTLCTFIALMFTIFDNFYFTDFTKNPASIVSIKAHDEKVGGIRGFYRTFYFTKEDCKDNNSLACILSNVTYTTKTWFNIFTVTNAVLPVSDVMVWGALARFLLILFLFYHFTKVLTALASELGGSFRADLGKGAMSPAQMVSKGVELTKRGLSAASTGGASEAEKAKDEVKSRAGGKDDGDKDSKDADKSNSSSGSES